MGKNSIVKKITIAALLSLLVTVIVIFVFIKWNQNLSAQEISENASLDAEFNQHNEPTATATQAYEWRLLHPKEISVEEQIATLPEGAFEFKFHDRLRDEFGDSMGLSKGEKNPVIILILSYHNTTESNQRPWDLLQKYYVFDQVMGQINQEAMTSLELPASKDRVEKIKELTGDQEVGRALILDAFMKQNPGRYENLIHPLTTVSPDQEVQVCYAIAPNVPVREVGVNIIEPVKIKIDGKELNYSFLIDKQTYNVSEEENKM